jgi:uncharacterized protein involved in exopolysaccharide biosynthesis
MPDMKASRIRGFQDALAHLDRMKENRQAKVAKVAELQAAIESLTSDIAAQRQRIRQLVSRIKTEMEDI